MNFCAKCIFNGFDIQENVQIVNLFTVLTEEMGMGMRMSVIMFLAIVRSTDFDNITNLTKEREIAVNGSETDMGKIFSQAIVNHFCRGVIITPAQVFQNSIALFRMFHRKDTVLSI